MNYQKCLERLYTANKNGIKLGLVNMQKMTKLLGMPHLAYKTIHVAGTNGKGSCVTKVATALELDGHKVGLYTSPHISTFRERIRVNNQMISEDQVTELLQHIFALSDQNDLFLTFFEYTTCLAFLHYARQRVDYAVLETGLGGRLDATNICQPDLTVITSISHDHTHFLGKTEEEIAFEKAGILKRAVPSVIGPRVPKSVVQRQADLVDAPLFFVTGAFSHFEEENQLIAKRAFELLQIGPQSQERALSAVPPCRFETICSQMEPHKSEPDKRGPKMIILDVAHNPDGIKKLFERLSEPAVVVAGFSKDKDVISCLDLLQRYASELLLVQAANERAMSVQELHSLAPQALPFKSLFEALSFASFAAAKKGQPLVICGTFYIMGDVRRFFGFEEPFDPIDLQERVAPMMIQDR